MCHQKCHTPPADLLSTSLSSCKLRQDRPKAFFLLTTKYSEFAWQGTMVLHRYTVLFKQRYLRYLQLIRLYPNHVVRHAESRLLASNSSPISSDPLFLSPQQLYQSRPLV